MPVPPTESGTTSAWSEQTWWVVLGAMTLSTFVYAFVLYLLLAQAPPAPPGAGAVRTALIAVAALGAAAALVVSRRRLRPREAFATESGPQATLVPPEKFQVVATIALALAELPVVCGFVCVFLTRGGLRDYVPFAVISLALLLFEVGPSGQRYWRARRALADSAGKPPPLA